MIGVAGILIVAVVFWAGLTTLFDALWAQRWIPTPCVVTRSELRDVTIQHHRWHEPGQAVSLSYSYSFAGRDYTSDRYDFADRIDAPTATPAMRELLGDNPVGSTRSCFVDPRDPANAVMRRDVPPLAWIALAVGVASTLSISIGFFSERRRLAAAASGRCIATNPSSQSAA